ncbi:hypothetical protein AN960_00145 [Bacillus sp. FJAT-25509]|uniref:glycosyltransferase n=1 Tax=Bacillus sp. FJAT-25509 TaxID=1712029 RepID=UPI0007016FB7|nr:glycosyltransferase [Bacillus sp. FJAT-25509]KQL42418.1 hypothetical protein AN960_00145 [Bacillus sp. FJAT-25509]
MTVYSLSVILINFNNEMFIKDTIESVLNQRMNNLELIIVDDGSTDGSLEISRNFTERHPNVKLISQKNSGPSAARNKGIQEATGKYITFLDSDDLTIKGAYEKLLEIANENDADTAIGNFICFNDLKKWRLAYMGKVFEKNLPSIRHVRKNSELHFTPAVWNKLYKREFILQKNIQFDESLRIGEDLLFTEKSLLLSNKTVVKDIDMIQYRVNDLDSSLVKKVSLSFFEQLLKTQNELNNLYNELELIQEIKTIENRQLRFFFDSIYLKASKLSKEEQFSLYNICVDFINIINNKEIFTNLKNRDLLLLQLILDENKDGFLKFLNVLTNSDVPKDQIRMNSEYHKYLIEHFPDYAVNLSKNTFLIGQNIKNISLEKGIFTFGGSIYYANIPSTIKSMEIVFTNKKSNEKINIKLVDNATNERKETHSKQYKYVDFNTVTIPILSYLSSGDWKVSIKTEVEELSYQTDLQISKNDRIHLKSSIIGKQQITPVYVNHELTLSIKEVSTSGRIKFLGNKLKSFTKRFV